MNIEQTIANIKGSYPEKYSDQHFLLFMQAMDRSPPTKKSTAILSIEGWFDIDASDAKFMLEWSKK